MENCHFLVLIKIKIKNRFIILKMNLLIEEMNKVIKVGIYQHKNGNKYNILHLALDASNATNLEKLVIYQPLKAEETNSIILSRKFQEFTEMVNEDYTASDLLKMKILIEEMSKVIKTGNIYEHYTGNKYQIFHLALDATNLEKLVIYHPLKAEEKNDVVWSRNFQEFTENVNDKPRFKLDE